MSGHVSGVHFHGSGGSPMSWVLPVPTHLPVSVGRSCAATPVALVLSVLVENLET